MKPIGTDEDLQICLNLSTIDVYAGLEKSPGVPKDADKS